MNDFEHNIKSDKLLKNQTITATTASSSVDLLMYGLCRLSVVLGDSGDTLDASNHIQLEVQESADDSTFTAVADADLSAAVTGTVTGTFAKAASAAGDDTLYQVEYRGKKRYVKVNARLTGTHTNGTPITVIADRAGARSRPVS